jgi:hypothetical protein
MRSALQKMEIAYRHVGGVEVTAARLNVEPPSGATPVVAVLAAAHRYLRDHLGLDKPLCICARRRERLLRHHLRRRPRQDDPATYPAAPTTKGTER